MKLLYNRESDFRRERNFGTKINATFEFISAHFRPLLKCLLYFVLPATLLLGIGMGLLFGSFGALARMAENKGSTSELSQLGISYLSGSGLVFIGATVSFLLMVGTVYSYVRVRMDLPANEVVQPAQVWAYLRPRLGRMMLSWLMFAAIGFGIFGVIGFVMFGTMGGLRGKPDVANILNLMWMIPVIGAIGIWFSVVLTQFFPIMLLEDSSIGTALRRSFSLVRGKWWSTFGLLLIAGFIQSSISYLFIIPLYGIMFAQLLKLPGLDSPVFSVIAGSFYAVGTVFVYAIPLLAVMFQYFNLIERKEGTGLRLLVDSLGQAAAPQVSSTTYRPDEEGEY